MEMTSAAVQYIELHHTAQYGLRLQCVAPGMTLQYASTFQVEDTYQGFYIFGRNEQLSA